MPDYKEMYKLMFKNSEQAIRLIIEAQQKCEELYLASGEKKETDEEAETSGADK